MQNKKKKKQVNNWLKNLKAIDERLTVWEGGLLITASQK